MDGLSPSGPACPQPACGSREVSAPSSESLQTVSSGCSWHKGLGGVDPPVTHWKLGLGDHSVAFLHWSSHFPAILEPPSPGHPHPDVHPHVLQPPSHPPGSQHLPQSLILSPQHITPVPREPGCLPPTHSGSFSQTPPPPLQGFHLSQKVPEPGPETWQEHVTSEK